MDYPAVSSPEQMRCRLSSRAQTKSKSAKAVTDAAPAAASPEETRPDSTCRRTTSPEMATARAKTRPALERGASPPIGEEELRTAHAMIRDKVNARSRELRKSFRAMDEDHSGSPTKQEIKDGLEILGITSKCVRPFPPVRPTDTRSGLRRWRRCDYIAYGKVRGE